MRRRVSEELLDTRAASAEEIQASLSDIRRINKRYGGVSAMREMLKQVSQKAGRRSLSVLDVAAGSGDVLSEAAEQLGRQGVTIEPYFLDLWPDHVRNAPGNTRIVGNAFVLPLREGAVDVVSCSLFLHHLEPEEIRRFVGEALRVCKVAFVANDLRRSRIHLWLNHLVSPTFSRVTKHDAAASIRRSYTIAEVREMLSNMAGTRLELSVHPIYRYGIVLWKM